MNTDTISTPAKILIYSTAAVILTLGMKAISDILVPVFFCAFCLFDLFSPCPLAHEERSPGKDQRFSCDPAFHFCFFWNCNPLCKLFTPAKRQDSKL